MVTSVNMHPDAWMDGVQVNANDLRLQAVSAHLTGASPSGSTGIAARPGVRYGTGSPLLVSVSSGMSITVNAGVAFVQGTASATAGMYTGCLDTTATLTVTTSDLTNPRIDNVIVQVTDVGTSSSTTVVAIQAGTPAPSPVAPTLPANSLLLATIAVGAGVSSITSGNINDARVFTAASGGIVPMANTSGGITGPAGLYAHDLSTGRLRVSDGSGNARAPRIAGWAPMDSGTSGGVNLTNPSTYVVVNSVAGTFDGVTEAMIIATWTGIHPFSPSVGDEVTVIPTLDGAVPPGAGVWTYRQDSTSTVQGGAATMIWYATPASGTHTIAVQAAGPSNYQVLSLRVRVVAMDA